MFQHRYHDKRISQMRPETCDETCTCLWSGMSTVPLSNHHNTECSKPNRHSVICSTLPRSAPKRNSQTQMPPAQKDNLHTTRKPPRPRHDSPKTRYSAPSSPMPKPFSYTLSPSLKDSSSTSQARRASVATTSLLRDSSPAIKPSNSSPAPKPLPLPAAKPLSSTAKPLPAAVKSPVRPGWIAPPGKYSPPTQIPTPKFVNSKRKSCSLCSNTDARSGGGRDVSVAPVTPTASLDIKKKSAMTPETPSNTPVASSPLFQKLVGAVEVDTPGFIVTKPTSENPGMIPRPSENSGDKKRRQSGLGLSFFGGLGLDFGVCMSTSPTSTDVDVDTDVASSGCPALSFVMADVEEEGKRCDTGDKERRDSLSPIHDSGFVGVVALPSVSKPCNKVDKPYAYLSPPSPLPLPSPSPIHPYVSGIHISPPCTSGSLTHRLTCGHLILTPSAPETCAHNCAVAKTTFQTARLKAQGFVANVRGLDQGWRCSVCEGADEREGDKDGKEGRKCVGVLSQEMLGSGNSEDREVCR